MAEHFLSQEEVDALLKGVTGDEDEEKIVEERFEEILRRKNEV